MLPLTCISSRIIEYSGTFLRFEDSRSTGERLALHDCKVITTHIKTHVVIIFFTKGIFETFMHNLLKTTSSIKKLDYTMCLCDYEYITLLFLIVNLNV